MKAIKPSAPPLACCVPLLPSQSPSLSCTCPVLAEDGCALPVACVVLVPCCAYHQLLEPIPYMFIAIPFPHVAATLRPSPRGPAAVHVRGQKRPLHVPAVAVTAQLGRVLDAHLARL